VDVVLQHKDTGKLLVLEIKTTYYSEVNESTYRNSSQALGYSIILDTIAPGASEYDVWYLVYKTTKQEFEIIPFTKLFHDRALWLKELTMDCERIEYYESEGHYPRHGESCRSYGRDCQHYGTCNMSTSMLSLPYDSTIHSDRDEGNYTVELTLLDLVDAQLTGLEN
jgi:hypothetical protein